MKSVGIIGHFGIGLDLYNGQTVKTKMLTEELENTLGKDSVIIVDTHGGIRKYFKLIHELYLSVKQCKNVVILPAKRGITVIAPLLYLFNKTYCRRLHYVVVGGWLPDFCIQHKALKKILKNYDYIYVETVRMKAALEEQGFTNVTLMPNFKRIQPITEKVCSKDYIKPFKLCTFSRVMKEKGIEDAVNAVESINAKHGETSYSLDIYGQIEKGQEEWFANLKKGFPAEIEYKGFVSPNESVRVLSNYYALLFPTFYEGEGFAGTVIDSMASGTPIIASNWKDNPEVITDEYNGLLFETHDVADLSEKIESLTTQKRGIISKNAIESSKKYSPAEASSILIKNLK